MMTCICAKLVSDAHTNRFMKSHQVYFCVVLVLNSKTMSLINLKIMNKSPITEYSDQCIKIRKFFIGNIQYIGGYLILGHPHVDVSCVRA